MHELNRWIPTTSSASVVPYAISGVCALVWSALFLSQWLRTALQACVPMADGSMGHCTGYVMGTGYFLFELMLAALIFFALGWVVQKVAVAPPSQAAIRVRRWVSWALLLGLVCCVLYFPVSEHYYCAFQDVGVRDALCGDYD